MVALSEKMSILNYFSAEESQEPVVSAPLLQTTKEMQIVTETVEKAVKDTGKLRGKYNSYSPENRAKIGKYASENGPTNHVQKSAVM